MFFFLLGISEAEDEHVYENMDVDTPGTDGKDGNVDRVSQSSVQDVPQAAPAAGAVNESDTSCFRRMFRTTFYRITFAIVIVGIMMSVVAMTMIILKTISTSKAKPHRPSHWPTPLEESSVSSTMSAESTTEATMMLPTEQSTTLPLNTTMTMVHRGLDETESPGKGKHTCAPGKCRDCAEIYEGGSTTSGVYLVTLQNNTPVEVYCDMDTDGEIAT
ncbi:uncharacterized protein LOC144907899 isoform X2 [Branchiostoma floridae x Branchiostoma belcheri]